jgi:cytochrome c biogenesis protein CcmG/thiol:disulfide interchange protein DsbE
MESKRGSRMVWAVIVAGIAFIALGLVFAGRFGADPGISSSPLIGKPVPTSSIQLMESDGAVSMAELSGDIVVVNFWASWCLGCRAEHDALLRAADDYAEFDTTFVAVNYQDSEQRAEAFLDELGRSAVTIYAIDEGSATAFEWGVLGLPETFFVDRNGIVVGKVSGPVSYGLLSRTIEQILVGEAIGDITTGEVENR